MDFPQLIVTRLACTFHVLQYLGISSILRRPSRAQCSKVPGRDMNLPIHRSKIRIFNHSSRVEGTRVEGTLLAS